MKLVALDGYTLNPGDLDWKPFQELADCQVYDRTPPEQVLARAGEAELLLTNKTILSAEILSQLPKLRYIGVLATGYNVVDVEEARRRRIRVTNVPGYGTDSVAQHTLALMIEWSNQVGFHAEGVGQGEWAASADWCYWNRPLVELKGLTLGIVGYGSIGRKVASMARAFGMTILAASRTARPEEPDVCFVGLDELLKSSDIISLHCPLTEETRGLIQERTLAMMKPTAFLINTSRGPLIDEAALACALQEGRIAGAALDVLSTEPPLQDNPLLTAPRCLITPHQAWATQAARRRLMDSAWLNLKAFLDGQEKNVVA